MPGLNLNRFVYFFILLAELAAIQFRVEILHLVAKPLLMIMLLVYFFREARQPHPLKKWIFFALVFSWAGDVLLLFQDRDPGFFLFGLVAFLIAHIFYILFFHFIRVREEIKSRPWLLLIVVVYYVSLIMLLSPYLGEMRLPVRIYGIVISFMLMLAIHMFYSGNKTAGRYMAVGAILFIISDSLLAINKFYQSFEPAGLLVMVTYGIAQFLITEGAIKYIRNS